MLQIPGVDKEFTRMNNERKSIHIRVTPRLSGGKSKTIITPKFKDDCQLIHPLAVTWYKTFKAHFESDSYKMMYKSILLRHHIKHGTVSTIASDPSFEV